MANVMWSPIYGKLAFFTDDIMMFDAYLLGGFGLAQTETGSKFASDIGIGLRYFLTSWMVVKLEVRDLIYTETLRLDVQQTQYSDIQNHLLLMAGVSFFFPVDFEYEFQ
jgi:outer membrane beta-barrel protein